MNDTNLLVKPKKFYTKFPKRPDVVSTYKQRATDYLKTIHHDVDDVTITSFIDQVVSSRFKDHEASVLFQTSLGNFEPVKRNLTEVLSKIKDLLISPYGAMFIPKSISESFFSEYIKEAQDRRKIVKKEEIIAQAKGNEHEATAKHREQLNIKIDINAITGIMLSNMFFGSPISYNAITSTARFNIMLAYSYTEMFLNGNMYFFNENKAINHVMNLLRVYPGDASINKAVNAFKLYEPSLVDVVEYFLRNLNMYAKFGRKKGIKRLLSSLSQNQLTFVFYACNFHNIAFFNDQFKQYFEDLFNFKDRLDDTVEGSMYTVEDQPLMNVVTTILSDLIGETPISDIEEKRPRTAKKIMSYYMFLQKRIKVLEPIFETFVFSPVVPSDIMRHKNMIRKNTILSDTDSIIFTTVEWAKWFDNGNLALDSKSLSINAMMTYLISKALEYVFGYTSSCLNIDEEDIKAISIKNEYLFTVFVRTVMGKHYAGLIKYREGACLNPPKLELKGKVFVGSDICKQSGENAKNFIKDILAEISTKYSLEVDDVIGRIILIEETIRRSIIKGEATYFNKKPIQTTYDKPMSSPYFYYVLWEEVFAEKKGDIKLPQKFQLVPIQPVTFKKNSTLDGIKEINPKMHKAFMKFLEKYPKRVIKTIFVPVGTEVPKELFTMINFTQVIYDNCVPIYLFAKSLQIVNSSTKKHKVLFSEEYPEVLKFIRQTLDEQEQKCQTNLN